MSLATSWEEVKMLRQFVLGAAVSACTITIHALVMAAVVRVAQKVSAIHYTNHSLLLIGVMIATVLVLMAAHTSEVMVWSLAYLIVGAVPPGGSIVYFAFVNYTTL